MSGEQTTSEGTAVIAANGRVDRNVVRLTRLQMAIIEYMARLGGDHVFISMTTAPPPDSALSGFTWAGVNLSLRSLTRRGVIRSSGANHGFYSLTHNSLFAAIRDKAAAAPRQEK